MSYFVKLDFNSNFEFKSCKVNKEYLKRHRLSEDASKEEVEEFIESKVFEIKKELTQPGFLFKKYFSKINQLKALEDLYFELYSRSNYTAFEWKPLAYSIHEDYPSMYQQKNHWSIFLQSLNNPEHIKHSVLEYELRLVDLAKSWINSVNTDAIDTKDELYKNTLLNQVGDPAYIYKALTKINAISLKESFNFHKFANDEVTEAIVKEVIKSHKFLKALDGRKR